MKGNQLRPKLTDVEWNRLQKEVSRKNESYYKSADRVGHSVPVNRQASQGRGFSFGKNVGERVYIIEFSHIYNNVPSFYKIGVTRKKISKRFEADFGRYIANRVGEIRCRTREQALSLEKSLHILMV
jgi:hypothetical protein